MTDTNHNADRGAVQAEASGAKPDVLRVLDWEALRERLARDDQPPLWRSLDEICETPEFFDYLHREFPRQASEWTEPASRRSFLKLMAASLGLAGVGLSGCMRQPDEKIVPYVRQPEDAVPGVAQYFATCTTLGGFATGLLVESQLGRPTKIEGNPEHPASLGAADVFSQAMILSLYDPDRSQTIMQGGRISTWGCVAELSVSDAGRMAQTAGSRTGDSDGNSHVANIGAPTLLLSGRISQRRSGTSSNLYREDNVRAGRRLAFGEYVDTIYHFDKADVILALDAEFLVGMPGSLRYLRQFVDRRRLVQAGNGGQNEQNSTLEMNRLYAVESTPGLTGAQADHRLPLKARDVEALTRAIAAQLGVEVAAGSHRHPSGVPAKWFDVLISDLKAHRGKSCHCRRRPARDCSRTCPCY